MKPYTGIITYKIDAGTSESLYTEAISTNSIGTSITFSLWDKNPNKDATAKLLDFQTFPIVTKG